MSDVRLIDANALNISVALYMAENAYLNDTPLDILRMVSRWIAEAHTIDAVPVVHGRWVHDDLGHTYCSGCNERLPYIHCYSDEPCSDYDEEWDEEIHETRYFPNCGAKMDAKDTDVPTKDGGAIDGN